MPNRNSFVFSIIVFVILFTLQTFAQTSVSYLTEPAISPDNNEIAFVSGAQNQKKHGVVVDVRNNNGGFINPYVIDIFARQGYLTMQERGLWKYPARSALGNAHCKLTACVPVIKNLVLE